ncbi:MAG: tetratricopeptide repeat protein [Myxococcales bacterium]|nr:tetratricopeptide repeat protein [Myxococcales bacterium]MCB9577563.1 tetratricopeptide repeat protein [Polyangiaceae bacterium]
MEFHDFARQPDQQLDVGLGALLIAKDAYPSLDLALEQARLDALGLGPGALRELPPLSQARVLSEHLYGELGFRGNDSDYYDPRNSYLNDVMERRVGIPITLAVIYQDVARRAGVSASGVNFPGHFLLRIDAPDHAPLFIDPFHGGGVLDRDALFRLWAEVTGGKAEVDDKVLRATSSRQTLVRMLMNLRAIYATRGDYRALYLVLDRIVELAPDSASEVRDRGLLAAKLGAPRAALEDLALYLSMAPQAGDVAEVRRIVDAIEGKIGPEN